MHSLISRSGVIAGDSWRTLQTAHGDDDLLVTLDEWRQRRAELVARPVRVGVRLAPADDPAQVAADLERLALIAVEFPSMVDGRGYSTARLLRARHGWRGELRACGPFTRDALFQLARCGFDTFELRAGEDAQAALAEFTRFDEVYQAAEDRGALFERRARAVAAQAGAPA